MPSKSSALHFFSAARSPNPAKRDVERYWLAFTLIWATAAGLVMLTGLAEHWTDRELLPFGVVLGTLSVLPPALFPRSEEERARPFVDRTATRLGATVVLFAFLMNYFCTGFFYDVLHMHYGFHSTVLVRDNPLFLYFLTVAYFATYASLLLGAYRLSRALSTRMRGPIAKLPVLLAPFAVAALETALNANPFMKRLFCYDDLAFALSFGTLSYGACFCFTLPVWRAIDEEPRQRPGAGRIIVWVAAAMVGMIVTFEILRRLVAPHFTEVHDGARGIGVEPGSCLEP